MSDSHITNLTSREYGTRLSGRPDGKVDLSPNNDLWEQW